MIPERLTEFWEDLRWWVRRAFDRLGGADPDDPQRVFRRRRRIAIGLLLIAVLGLLIFVPVPGIPCSVSPAKTCVPSDDAIDLVPADADAYLHFNLDPDSSQYSTAQDVLGRLPHAGQIEQGLFSASGLAPGVDLRADVGGWIGDEAAFATIGKQERPLALYAIGEPGGAKSFESKLGAGKVRQVGKPASGYRVYGNGLAFANADDFLLVGSAPAVRAARAASRSGRHARRGRACGPGPRRAARAASRRRLSVSVGSAALPDRPRRGERSTRHVRRLRPQPRRGPGSGREGKWAGGAARFPASHAEEGAGEDILLRVSKLQPRPCRSVLSRHAALPVDRKPV